MSRNLAETILNLAGGLGVLGAGIDLLTTVDLPPMLRLGAFATIMSNVIYYILKSDKGGPEPLSPIG